jgi:hypothetical protein
VIARFVVVVVVGGVVLAGIVVRYQEPQIAARLVHRYGVAPPLIACVALILLARKIFRD